MVSPASAEVVRSFGTIREMLRARRMHDLSSLDDEAAFGDAAIEALGDEQHVNNVFHLDLPSCRVRVVYDLNPKFKMANVRALLEDPFPPLPATEAPEAPTPTPTAYVLVVRERPVQGKAMEELRRRDVKGAAVGGGRDIQMFLLKELQYNVMRHALVPPHEPIRDEAAIKAVLRRYQIKSRYQLPLILSTDPVARHLALKPGQLVFITRPSPSAGTYPLYRCCQRAY
jgi:DNA-directed RNA polymerase subunit H (RpoH/RPB5)